MSNLNIGHIRHDYTKFRLDENSIKQDPIEQFEIWFNHALEGDFVDPNAVVVSTATKDGKPSSRVLLLKGYDKRGFVFYSNYESRKGNELEENPQASLLFFWDKFERQIRIEGRVEKLSPEESYEYFKTRPYASRVGAWASSQSRPLKSRFTLLREVAKLAFKFKLDVPLPPFWGGYRLVPEYFEFWQGRESRLHDRFAYSLKDGLWKIERLSP